ncbi:two-component system response regulator [candidate division KSB3 bacterium]|uniref:Two-component system response regulator n=1 Tax=candidate division KSB3 bacterium TaxID=2044937 RepID=A0A2G6E8M6_9BACT|nr:MAG: two-component system response regulator [candidate division KSB3 bacterium]PIE30602.1 MAG: two-component system response regulator [candidate division KSB3 bacterium]
MSKNILIVDDSEMTRRLISTAIRRLEDIEYEEAKDGFEAIQKLPTNAFDMLFVDINMPNINGLELIDYCKQSEQYRQIPIVIISTEDSRRDQEKGLELGASAYLLKPIQLDQLLDVIKTTLGRA